MTPEGDYGYDMAHQDMPRGVAREVPGQRARPHDEAQPERPSAGAAEEDLGYDEAHDF